MLFNKINFINIVKKIIHFLGFKVNSDYKIYPLYKKNIFKKNYQKRVLISYLIEPFTVGVSLAHSNLKECYTAAEIFDKFGYNVDVIDFSYKRKINYKKYEVIYGMGEALEQSFYYNSTNKLIRIFYATGCNPLYANLVTVLKVRDFNDKHNKLLLASSRLMSNAGFAQVLLSNFVIVLGNNFVLNTYTMFDSKKQNRYLNLNAFYNDVYKIDLNEKNFKVAKKNFLWFGSTGILHKGLDILLDIFHKREDIYLHICGASQKEVGFFEYYQNVLSKSSNIINHGFVQMESAKFKEIMNVCGFVISPSVSEGGAPSLLNVMANGGLVPIATRSSGIDLDELGWVVEVEDNHVEGFDKVLNEVCLINESELRNKAMNAKKVVRDKYTFHKYQNELEKIITTAIQKNTI